MQELDREPTPQEVAQEMGIAEKEVMEMFRISQEPVSLNKKVNEEDDAEEVGDFVADQKANTAEAASNTLLKTQIGEAIDALSPKEKRIIQLRFGLEDNEPRTLEQIGDEFGVSRERIRQIESEALRKLRQASIFRELKDYLDTE